MHVPYTIKSITGGVIAYTVEVRAAELEKALIGLSHIIPPRARNVMDADYVHKRCARYIQLCLVKCDRPAVELIFRIRLFYCQGDGVRNMCIEVLNSPDVSTMNFFVNKDLEGDHDESDC